MRAREGSWLASSEFAQLKEYTVLNEQHVSKLQDGGGEGLKTCKLRTEAGTITLNMIDWIYSVAGFWTGVRTLYQKFSQRTKTVLVTSNRFRVVSNIMYDGFVQFGKPVGPEQVPSRLAAPPGRL